MLSDIKCKKSTMKNNINKLNVFKIINGVLFSSFLLLKTPFSTSYATGNVCLEVNNKNERSKLLIKTTEQRQVASMEVVLMIFF